MAQEIIDQSTIFKDFYNHVKLERNEKILFSGAFGTGKTTYLEYFFKHYNKEFLTLKLSPVHYVVSTTDDVFELIKYDILIQLGNLLSEVISEEEDFIAKTFTALSYIKNDFDFYAVGKAIVNLIPNADRAVDLLDTIKNEVTKISDSVKDITKAKERKIAEYKSSIELLKGNIYENDPITQLIKHLIELLKTKFSSDNRQKDIVLIIDDLDRLDPEHIFRLFNVFSSHYRGQDQSHKFGVDKVILVCDYNNVKQIYQHRYGIEVDFNGYIDKYYSVRPFYLNNKEIMINSINSLIDINRRFKNIEKFQFNENILKWIMTALLSTDVINLRKLLQPGEFEITVKNFYLLPGFRYKTIHFPVLNLIHILRQYISIDTLLNAFEKLSISFIHPDRYDDDYTVANKLNTDLLFWLIPPNVWKNIDNETLYAFSFDGIAFNVRISKLSYEDNLPRITTESYQELNTYNLFIAAIRELRKRDILN